MITAKRIRRSLIGQIPLFLAATLLLDCGTAATEETAKRPAGACPAWNDQDSNGFCDRSEGELKPCQRKNCPAHIANPEAGKSRMEKAPAK